MGAATPPQDRAADCHEAKTDCQNKVPSETPHTSCHQALEKLGMQIFGIPSSIFSPNTLLVQQAMEVYRHLLSITTSTHKKQFSFLQQLGKPKRRVGLMEAPGSRERQEENWQERNTQKAQWHSDMHLGISEWFRMGRFVTSDLIRRLFSGC